MDWQEQEVRLYLAVGGRRRMFFFYLCFSGCPSVHSGSLASVPGGM